MKIGVIIPTRGDRPLFLAHAERMLKNQTRQPDEVFIVDYPPTSEKYDITARYRTGYDYFRNNGFDVLFLWEDDDFYAQNYIETMLFAWESAGKPDLFGLRKTIYYHIRIFAYYPMYHEQRSSAMSTMIKPDLAFAWCPDHEPYTDVWLFSQIPYQLWSPPEVICMGIKHGIGLTVKGGSHIDRMERFTTGEGRIDVRREFLRATVDLISYEFYVNYFGNSQDVP